MIDKWTGLWCMAIFALIYLFTLNKATYFGALKNEKSQKRFELVMAYLGCLVMTCWMIWVFS